MSTRDSGIIDLFAIHKEEQERLSAPAPSAPPPAVSFDTGADDDGDLDALGVEQRAARRRAKIVGAAIGAMAVIGILIAAIASGSGDDGVKATVAAALPPPPAVTTPAPGPAPVTEPPPAPVAPEPAPPPSAKAGADYTPKTAAAAYAASHGKKKAPARKASKKGGGVKLQKVQSSGTGG